MGKFLFSLRFATALLAVASSEASANFVTSAIAFRRIDYRLKPRLNASARVSPRAPRTTREAAMAAVAKSWRRSCTVRADEVIK